MANECLAAIHLCRVRATRLNPDGTPTSGANNVYVSDKPVDLTVTPVYEAGKDSTLIGGCDCILADYHGYDKFRRFDFELTLAVLEWGLLEMLTGGPVVEHTGDLIGLEFPTNAFDCSVPAQPNIAFEGWQTGWDQDRQDTTWPYVHWVWPSTYWSLDALTLQNDFAQPKLKGFSRGNSAWGTGIFHDAPQAIGPLGDAFYDTAIPAASCGYQSHSIT